MMTPMIMLPFIYDMGAQVLQIAENKRELNTPMIIVQAVNMQLRKFLDKRTGMNTESTLYAAVVDLLSNLAFPMPGQPMPQGPPQPVMQGNMNVNVPTGQFLSPGMPPQMQVNQMQQMPPQMQMGVGVNPMVQGGVPQQNMGPMG
jgi:hypothetical protein